MGIFSTSFVTLLIFSSISLPYLILAGFVFLPLAILTALSSNLPRPVPPVAIVGIIGMPRDFCSWGILMVMPFSLATSIWFSAMIIGVSSSSSWMVKKRFLSSTEASTMFMTMSGF